MLDSELQGGADPLPVLFAAGGSRGRSKASTTSRSVSAPWFAFILAPPLSHHAQALRLLGRVKRDARLFQHPGFNLVVPHAQQVEGAAAVMLLGKGARLVAHDLRGYAAGRLDLLITITRKRVFLAHLRGNE